MHSLTPRKALVVCFVLLLALFIYSQLPTPLHETGLYPDPVQAALDKPLELKSPEGYKITATDSYALRGLVVSVCRYYMGRDSKLSPVDFAVVWGALAQEPNLPAIHYTQSGRWYFYKYNPFKVNVSPWTIISHSSNNHIVIPPENDDLRSFLLGVHRGDTVQLTGYLVRITAPDGWNWSSSRSRTDTGDHSCELFYVTEGRRI